MLIKYMMGGPNSHPYFHAPAQDGRGTTSRRRLRPPPCAAPAPPASFSFCCEGDGGGGKRWSCGFFSPEPAESAGVTPGEEACVGW